MSFPSPHWLTCLAEDKRQDARRRFLIRLAALYFSERGKVTDLSAALGLHRNALTVYTGRRTVPVTGTALRDIERLTKGAVKASDFLTRRHV